MKCDIILYSKTAAVGLKYFPKNCDGPIVMFMAWAKKCAANNYLSEWQTEVLAKILQKAECFESNIPLTRHFMYGYVEGWQINDATKKNISQLYEKHFSKAGKVLSEELYSEKIQKNFKKEIQIILQKPTYKSLLLKEVICEKYLKRAKVKYCLEHNERDNNWYYKQIDKNGNTLEKAGYEQEETLKQNIKYELRECEFVGVVVKIGILRLSTFLGVEEFQEYCLQDLYTFFRPIKADGFSIPVATVIYQNGRKRLVPLSCIIEYEGFSNGADIERVIKNIETVENYGDKNLITQKEDGTIEIDNSFLYLDLDFNVKKANRMLVLDIANRTVRWSGGIGSYFFKISDEEYKNILEIMKEQMKKECGFEPKLVYGETNFDRLINFTYAPYNPELAEFRFLFKNRYRLERAKEHYGKEFAPPTGAWEDFANSPDCVPKFIKMCGLPYKPRVLKIFLSGHREFADFLGIWLAGFRDERAIDYLMSYNEKFLFGTMMFQSGFFYNPVLNGKTLTCFAVSRKINLFENIQFLFKYYDELTSAKLMAELLENVRTNSIVVDAFDYMINLAQENNLSEQIIKKIRREGFTQYNHDMLMRVFRQSHPEQKEQFENLPIAYSPEEKQLEWENDGYKFCLPEDTNRLVDIGYRMNICVGHLYREKAAQKQCVIVYAIKNDEYELCVELRKTSDNRFEIVQRSAFSNREPKGRLLTAFNSWRMAKNVG